MQGGTSPDLISFLISRKHVCPSFPGPFNFWKIQTLGPLLWFGRFPRQSGTTGVLSWLSPSLRSLWKVEYYAYIFIIILIISLYQIDSTFTLDLSVSSFSSKKSCHPNLFNLLTILITRWVSDWEVGVPPWTSGSTCVHCLCHWSWYCNWPYKVCF